MTERYDRPIPGEARWVMPNGNIKSTDEGDTIVIRSKSDVGRTLKPYEILLAPDIPVTSGTALRIRREYLGLPLKDACRELSIYASQRGTFYPRTYIHALESSNRPLNGHVLKAFAKAYDLGEEQITHPDKGEVFTWYFSTRERERFGKK